MFTMFFSDMSVILSTTTRIPTFVAFPEIEIRFQIFHYENSTSSETRNHTLYYIFIILLLSVNTCKNKLGFVIKYCKQHKITPKNVLVGFFKRRVSTSTQLIAHANACCLFYFISRFVTNYACACVRLCPSPFVRAGTCIKLTRKFPASDSAQMLE